MFRMTTIILIAVIIGSMTVFGAMAFGQKKASELTDKHFQLDQAIALMK